MLDFLIRRCATCVVLFLLPLLYFFSICFVSFTSFFLLLDILQESTKEATLNHLSTRVADNLLYYDFDYTLETTRGNKRVVSTVCINKNKLYIANGQYFCGEACSEENADKLLLIRNSLQSFAVY